MPNVEITRGDEEYLKALGRKLDLDTEEIVHALISDYSETLCRDMNKKPYTYSDYLNDLEE